MQKIIVSFIYASIFWQDYPRKLFKLGFDFEMCMQMYDKIADRIHGQTIIPKKLDRPSLEKNFVRNLNCEFAFVISFCISNCDLNFEYEMQIQMHKFSCLPSFSIILFL